MNERHISSAVLFDKFAPRYHQICRCGTCEEKIKRGGLINCWDILGGHRARNAKGNLPPIRRPRSLMTLGPALGCALSEAGFVFISF